MRNPHNERVSSDIAADGPERKCILSGEHASRDATWCVWRCSLADAPDGTCMILPDALARAPGRGAWIGVSRADLETAMAKGKLKGALARAFKGAKIIIPDDLPQRIEVALTRAFDRPAGAGTEMRTAADGI